MTLRSARAVMKPITGGAVHAPWYSGSRFSMAPVLGTVSLVIFTVLAFGAVEEWSTLVMEISAVALFIAYLLQQTSRNRLGLPARSLLIPAALFIVIVVAQLAFRRSATPYETKYAAMQYAAYGMVMISATYSLRNSGNAKLFAMIMTVFGVAYAAFALIQDFNADGKLYWTLTSPGWVYGSYVNHSHYAGLMEMLIPLPLIIVLGELVSIEKRILAGFGTVIMLATLFLCGSRGGMIAFLVELVVCALLTGSSRHRRATLVVFVSVFIASVLFLTVARPSEHLIARWGDLGPGDRLRIATDALHMFAQRPFLGWGLGSFALVYPPFQTVVTPKFVNAAHNDYMQLLVEMGAPGFVLMLWFLAVAYRRGLRKARSWATRWQGALALAAVVGCTGILAHSFMDFNLQIPANALLFYLLCGIAALEPQAYGGHHRSGIAADGNPEL